MFGYSGLQFAILLGVVFAVVAVAFFSFRLFLGRDSGNPDLFNRSRRTIKLIRDAKRLFVKQNWTVKNFAYAHEVPIDLYASNKLMNLEITFVDTSILRYRSDSALLERLDEWARIIRLHKATPLVVVDRAMNDDFFLRGTKIGLPMIWQTDVPEIADLAAFVDDLPQSLSAIQRRIMQSSFIGCDNFAHRYRKAKNLEEAISWTKFAIASRPGYSSHLLLFELLIETGNLEFAKDVAEEALTFRTSPKTPFFRGLQKIALTQGDLDTALVWAQRWTKDDAGNAQAFNNLAQLYQQTKNGIAAAAAINEALALAPKEQQILKKAVQICIANNDLDDAFKYAQILLEDYPQDSDSHELLAEVNFRYKHYQDAKIAIQDALKLKPTSAQLLRRASQIAFECKDIDLALEFSQRWIGEDPQNAWAYDHLSIILLNDSKIDQARDANAKALALDPDNIQIRRRAAHISNLAANTNK